MAKIVCESKAIVPQQFTVDDVIAAVPEAVREAIREIYLDYARTVQNWDHKPDFRIMTNNKDTATVSTDDENYARIDRGIPADHSKVYTARRRASGRRFYRISKRRPKTRPGVIASSGGGPTGEVVYRATRRYGGIEPRRFTETIIQKHQEEFPKILLTATERGIKAGISDKSKEVKVKA